MSDFNSSVIENVIPSIVKARLADFLTLSRLLIGIVILLLGLIGKEAYITVVIMALVGAATDILDGKAARHFLGENREGKLGKHDLLIDTLFVLCILGYFSFSEIVIPKAVGLGWIVSALITISLCKGKTKVIYLFEIPSILALIAMTGIYDTGTFLLVILPAICVATIINRRRILYLIFEYIPKSFFD